MKIVVGLGNPGTQYARTRHNAGWMMVDALREHFLCSPWSLKKKLNAYVSEGRIGSETIVLVKPNVFMNQSGGPVQSVLHWHKADPSDLVVIHDDTDLPLGSFKMHINRGSAGHKGISSIATSLATKNFYRIRLGVRPEDNTLPAMDIVLERMSAEEYHTLMSSVDDVAGKLTSLFA